MKKLCALTLTLSAISLVACGGGGEPEVAVQPQASADAATTSDPPASTPTPPAPLPTPAVQHSCPDDEPRLINMCLRMTPEEVMAAVQARNPQFEIREKRANYDYSDGAQKLRTEPFTREINAESDAEYLSFSFTAPPDGRLTYMSRSLGSDANNLPPLQAFADGVKENYGEPDYVFDDADFEIIKTMRWDFPEGRSACFRDAPDKSNRGTVGGVNGRGDPSGILTMVKFVASQGFEDPTQCAKWLQVQLRTRDANVPVEHVTMELGDFASAVSAAEATMNWLEELEAEARKARLDIAEMPDL